MKLRGIISSTIASALVVAALTPSAGIATPVTDLVGENYQGLQWSLQAVRAQAAWDDGYTGNGVTVAVIDSGVDSSHPDLTGQLVDGATINYNYENLLNAGITLTNTDFADFTDEVGHGTHVAGIIAAKHNSVGTTGLAYNAEIMPIKLNDLEAMDLPAFAQAIDDALQFAVDNGAQVASLSLGGTALEESVYVTLNSDDLEYKSYTNQICAAVSDATNAGVLVVAAAGNDRGSGNGALVPSSCADALSVAASAPNSNNIAYFSTTDATVDLTAPGEYIASTIPTNLDAQYFGQNIFGEFPYQEMSGTSMATPLVSAAAALYIEKDGEGPSPAETAAALYNSATDMTAINGWDPYTGAGLVDAAALVGAEVKRTAAPITHYLPVSARPAYNFSDSLTFYWDAPALADLPDSYDLAILEKTSEVVHTYNFSGFAIKGTVPWLEIDDYAYYQVTAHYDGFDVVSLPALFSIPLTPTAFLDTPTGLTYSLGNDGRLTVMWNSYGDLDADNLILQVAGSGVDYVWEEMSRTEGEFQTSLKVNLIGTDVMNSDFEISLMAVSDVGESSEPATSIRYAAAPMALTYYEVSGNQLVRINAAPNQAGCDLLGFIQECLGRTYTYNYKVSANFATSGGSRGSLPPNAGRTVNGYFAGWDLWFDVLRTGVGINGSLNSISLTASPFDRSNRGKIYPVNIRLNMPCPTSPTSNPPTVCR